MAEVIFFEKSQKLFKILRIWYNKDDNNTKFSKNFKSWVIIISCCFVATLSFVDVINAMQTDRLDVKLTKFLFMCVVLVVTQKVCTVTYTGDKIIGCITQLEKLSSRFKNKTYFEKYHRLYVKVFFFGIWAINISVFFFMVAPVIFFRKKTLFFDPKIANLNMQKSPIWELMFIYQSIIAFVFTNITFAYDTIYGGLLLISAGALKSISREIREVDEVITEHQLSEKKLKDVIDKIIEISSLTNTMSDIFAMTTIIHIIHICGIMGLGLYVMSLMQFNDLYFFSMMLATIMSTILLFIYCYFGQILVDQRRNLLTELYFLKWYDASRNVKILILVSISVLQRDGFVYAGKIIPLSMETFGQVLGKAYAFFTFMNEFKYK